ncbi:hypothetical protein [Xylophilus sp.]|uniref:hypothetical protein n=1 Tax=Xylophilus sp. TaxID=2653893 RepID=UPI0013B80BBA|nr:hypothetical protein [Xylophilus sp.]KAF1049196.1 MAG: hypothetical protein GAK38_00964 [Xylophilus sp.]
MLFAAVFPPRVDAGESPGSWCSAAPPGRAIVSPAVYATGGRQIRRRVRSARPVRNLNRASGFLIGAGGLLAAMQR